MYIFFHWKDNQHYCLELWKENKSECRFHVLFISVRGYVRYSSNPNFFIFLSIYIYYHLSLYIIFVYIIHIISLTVLIYLHVCNNFYIQRRIYTGEEGSLACCTLSHTHVITHSHTSVILIFNDIRKHWTLQSFRLSSVLSSSCIVPLINPMEFKKRSFVVEQT